MATADRMQIKYEQLRWAGSYLDKLGTSFDAHIVEETLPGGYVEFDVRPTRPDMVVGKTYYWTNTAGATSSRCYLGLLSIEIVEIPSWVGEEQCES